MTAQPPRPWSAKTPPQPGRPAPPERATEAKDDFTATTGLEQTSRCEGPLARAVRVVVIRCSGGASTVTGRAMRVKLVAEPWGME